MKANRIILSAALSLSVFIYAGCSSEEDSVAPQENANLTETTKKSDSRINQRSSCGTNNIIDIGNHMVKNWQSDDFKGWSCMDWNGDISSFTVTWECSGGETLPIVYKSSDGNSPGYPKKVDQATQKNLDCSIKSSYEFWAYSDGLWGHHINIWLDDSSSPSWPYTTEIMIFDNWGWHEPWEWAEWVGSINTNGAEYECWKWNHHDDDPSANDINSYILLRKHDKKRNSGTVRLKTILQWLRTKGVPNHHIVSIGWGFDAFGSYSKGKWAATDIVIPNL